MQAAQQRTQYTFCAFTENAVKGVVLLFSRSSIFMNALLTAQVTQPSLRARFFCILFPKGVEQRNIRFLPLLLIK
jgi:hypothetical protein